jgi:protein SCO1/2
MNPADPNDLSTHDTDIVMGNETTGQWIKRSSFENPLNIAHILGDTMNNASRTVMSPDGPRRSYAAAGHITDTSQGIYLFRTRCASCHTIGQGDRLGPDLRGVVGSRDHAWLLRWIQNPDRMIAARDPIALQLMGRYRNLPMPNLHLAEPEAEALIDYLRGEDARLGARH